MKKTLLIISIMASLQAFSQIPKGTMYGGLGLGFSSGKSVDESKTGSVTVKGEPSKLKSFNLAPEFSYFIMDNLSVGAFIGFGSGSFESTDKTSSGTTVLTSKSSGPSFGIFARKFWNVNETFNTFAGLSLAMDNSKGSFTNKMTPTSGPSVEIKTESESKMSAAVIDFGMTYNITPKFMFVGSFSALSLYSSTDKYDIDGDDYDQTKDTGFDFMFDSSTPPFNFGFIYLLGGGSE